MNKKISLGCVIVGAAFLGYGLMNFELNGIRSTTLAIAVSMSLVLGATMLLYGLYSFFKGKPTTVNKGEKPMMTAKQLEKANKKKAPKTNDTSVGLMRREKELETRRKELQSLLAEAIKEEKSVEKMLKEKGWVQKDGSWAIE